jgi:hypothetical protein
MDARGTIEGMTTVSTAPSTSAKTPTREGFVWAAIGVTVVLWASAFVGIRAAAHDFSAGGQPGAYDLFSVLLQEAAHALPRGTHAESPGHTAHVGIVAFLRPKSLLDQPCI